MTDRDPRDLAFVIASPIQDMSQQAMMTQTKLAHRRGSDGVGRACNLYVFHAAGPDVERAAEAAENGGEREGREGAQHLVVQARCGGVGLARAFVKKRTWDG